MQPTTSSRPLWAGRRLHFVGIGGCGMSSLALVADTLGARITGSDRSENGRFLPQLRDRGITVRIGHSASYVPAGAEVVYSSAIPPENPERRAAAESGVREVARGELLAEFANGHPRCIAVAGTHGKTTTAAMIVHALRAAGDDPAFIVGGLLLSDSVSALWTGGRFLVIETDESDGSHLHIRPAIGLLTNVDHDHIGRYPDLDAVRQSFQEFVDGAEQQVLADLPELVSVTGPRVTRFRPEDVTVADDGVRFSWDGRRVMLTVPGVHNAWNAAATLAACAAAGADVDAACAGLASFRGTGRRLEYRGSTSGGVRVYDDYAHHPTAVRASLQALAVRKDGRLIAVIQPWGRRRVAALYREFAEALDDADAVVLLPTVTPSDPPPELRGIGSELIADTVRARHPRLAVAVVDGIDDAVRQVRSMATTGDLVVTVGCGDVDRVARNLLDLQ